MSYESLPTELQNVLLVNHQYIAKWFIFLVLGFLSMYYIFFIFPYRCKTKSILVLLSRFVFISCSWSFLLTMPLTFVLLDPASSLWSVYTVPFTLYLVFSSIFLFALFFKLFKDGLLGILLYFGIDTGDPEVRDTLSKIKNVFGGFGNA